MKVTNAHSCGVMSELGPDAKFVVGPGKRYTVMSGSPQTEDVAKFDGANSWRMLGTSPQMVRMLQKPSASCVYQVIALCMCRARAQWISEASASLRFKPNLGEQTVAALAKVHLVEELPYDFRKAMDYLLEGWRDRPVKDVLKFLEGAEGKRAERWATQGRPNTSDKLKRHPVTQHQRELAEHWVASAEQFLEPNLAENEPEGSKSRALGGTLQDKLGDIPLELRARVLILDAYYRYCPIPYRLYLVRKAFLE